MNQSIGIVWGEFKIYTEEFLMTLGSRRKLTTILVALRFIKRPRVSAIIIKTNFI